MLDEAMGDQVDKAIVIVDVDLLIDETIMKNFTKSKQRVSDRHNGGELFIDQVFVVPASIVGSLVETGIFFSNVSPTDSIVDMLSGYKPSEGTSSGVARQATKELSQDLKNRIAQLIHAYPDANIYRFVSPQAFSVSSRKLIDANGRVLDPSKFIQKYEKGQDQIPSIKQLEDKSTGDLLDANVDFYDQPLVEVFGYWQKVDKNFKTTIIGGYSSMNKLPVRDFSTGSQAKVYGDKIKAFVDFVMQRNLFLKGNKPAEVKKISYVLIPNMPTSGGKRELGKFEELQDAITAAKRDFDERIQKNQIKGKDGNPPPSPDELIFDEKAYTIKVPQGRFFNYTKRPGYMGSAPVQGWPTSQPVYVILKKES